MVRFTLCLLLAAPVVVFGNADEQCFVDYCNVHADLKSFICNGGDCTGAQYWTCKGHWNNMGKRESTRVCNPEDCDCGAPAGVTPAPVAADMCPESHPNAYDYGEDEGTRMYCCSGDVSEDKIGCSGTVFDCRAPPCKDFINSSVAQCFLDYCNAHADLKAELCSGSDCTTKAHYDSCVEHWNDHGKGEHGVGDRSCNPENHANCQCARTLPAPVATPAPVSESTAAAAQCPAEFPKCNTSDGTCETVKCVEAGSDCGFVHKVDWIELGTTNCASDAPDTEDADTEECLSDGESYKAGCCLDSCAASLDACWACNQSCFDAKSCRHQQAGAGDAAECEGITNLSPGLYIRMNKAKLEQKTKLVDENVDPICECHDLCKEKSADAFMYYTKGKKKPKAICKCYMDIVAANEDGKLKLQIGGTRTKGKNAGWITDAAKDLISKDKAKDTKRRIKERKQSKKRRRGRRN